MGGSADPDRADQGDPCADRDEDTCMAPKSLTDSTPAMCKRIEKILISDFFEDRSTCGIGDDQ